jgi:hypothetical protein
MQPPEASEAPFALTSLTCIPPSCHFHHLLLGIRKQKEGKKVAEMAEWRIIGWRKRKRLNMKVEYEEKEVAEMVEYRLDMPPFAMWGV